MIRISQLKLPVSHSREDLEKKIEKTLGVSLTRTESWRIVRRSVDARKKDQLLYIYSIDVKAPGEEKLVRRARNRNVELVQE